MSADAEPTADPPRDDVGRDARAEPAADHGDGRPGVDADHRDGRPGSDADGRDRAPDGGLDAIDRTLLTLLQDDGRLPYSDLAAATGLSSGAARARVLRLRERGILQIVGVTDPLKLGYRSMVLLAITIEGDVDAVAEAIGQVDGVIYVVLAAGPADLLVEVVAPDPDALHETINRHIRPVPGVRTLQTYTYYRTHTHRFTWGAR